MKKKLTLLTIILLSAVVVIGQSPAPGIFNYQGVARNSHGNVLANRNITMRLTIRDESATGPHVYQEVRAVTTTNHGLFNVLVGSAGATNVIGTIAGVNWGVALKFIQVEIDPHGGTSFINIGTAQLASVPYSLYSTLANDMVLPFNKTQADAGTLFRITNSGSSVSGAIMGVTNSNAANAWGVHGIAPTGIGVHGASTSGIGVNGVSNSGTGGRFITTSGLALHTTGNLRLQGIGEGINNILMTDAAGNANWNTLASVGGVSGTGTLNVLPKWTPNGTFIGNSQIFDDGTNVGIGTTTPVFKTEIATTGGDDGLRLITTNSNNIRLRMHNTTANKEYSMLVGGTGSGFGSGNFVLTDVGSGDAVRLLINGATGNVGIGGGTLNPGARLQVEQSAASGGGLFVNHSNASNTSDALSVATNGTGFAASFTNTNAVPMALRTQGALQFTGIGEGVNRILMTDAAGNANWNTLASVGSVSGTGTLNVLSKWTPNGTFIGNSQIFDDGTSVGIGTLTPSAKLHVKGNQKIDSAFTLEFGAGIAGKEANAGKIGYQTFTAGALDIIGAGTLGTNRKINFFAEGGTVFNGNVGIGIANPSFRLDVNGNTPGYLAQFNNLNTGDGDGIRIKLGRTHPLWIENESRYHTATNLSTTFGPQLNMVRDWVLHGTAPNVFELLSSTGALLVGTLCVLTNRALQEANNLLGLPIYLGEILIVPSIPELNCTGFPAVQIPGLASSNVANSLTDLNNFIQFADKDDRQLGAIRAQSIVDWRTKTLDAGYFFELAGKFVGVDLVKGFVHGGSAMFKLGTAFNKIGVEYMSGNGDYAEWLERSDVNERISYGDIVGIKGGKISKDLSGAEQIMVASHRPIVLGNMPQEEKKPFGNAVAFMGQVPVKVMGPVASGDYIVAKGEFAGMGIAMNPLKMSADDFRFAVGRSWDTNENEGPKMVNTVVGVHNNDFLKIVSGMQQRLDAIEAKLNIGQELKTQTNKKSF